jgi:arylformamidase
MAEPVDRAAIDRDYNARASVPLSVFEAAMARYRSLSAAAIAALSHELDIVYDEASGETLDIVGTGGDLRPVFVFIHGGYWRALSKKDSAFMALPLAKSGIATVAVDYTLAPAASLEEIVRQVRAAIAWIVHRGSAHGLDPGRIFVGGSSAGGHLTGAVLAKGWHADAGIAEDAIKGAMPISGLFDLLPLVNSFVNEWLGLDAERAAALSPAFHLPRRGYPLLAAYADGEPQGFSRQSRNFCERWRAAGLPGGIMEIAGRNHFDVVLDLADENSRLSLALARMIRDGD